MQRKMRRFRQALAEEENIAVLERNTSGVLALNGDDGYPYAVPLNYVYKNGKIYFHSAVSGHKLDAIRHDEKASFCVKDTEKTIPEKFTAVFKSVIVFGRAHITDDESEKRAALCALAEKFSPNETEYARDAEKKKEWKNVCVIVLEIEHMTGKQAIELVK